MEVSIINAMGSSELENKINDRIKRLERIGLEVIDVKFGGYGFNSKYGWEQWTAMIIYRKSES